MKSLARAAGLASCCLLSTLSLAQAGEVMLSEAALDRVTAGALLFEVDNSAFGSVNNQLTPGGLIGPPAPPPVITPPPPLPPVVNPFVVTDGPATARVTPPAGSGDGTLAIVLEATSGDGFAAAAAGLVGSITGGNNSRFTGGGSSTNISGTF